VALYLYVCLGALQLFKDASLHAQGIHYAPYGVAAVKALILGKFMLIGHALGIGERDDAEPLIYPILRKSLSFVALLFVLDLLEEVGVGALHGRPVIDSFFAIAGGTGLQIAAACILLFLVLLPYFAYRELGRSLGEGTLWRMLFESRTRAMSVTVPFSSSARTTQRGPAGGSCVSFAGFVATAPDAMQIRREARSSRRSSGRARLSGRCCIPSTTRRRRSVTKPSISRCSATAASITRVGPP
jgi:hypothetical protein